MRESTHGGYVWTCCDECGPDVKVDEDGLCIACGRNAVYFGKKHPDDTPPQRRDAGDILREKLSDPEAMQRVTERAAEQQDAMLERRDALEALVSVLPEIEFGRETHRKWRDYLRAYPEQIKENPDIGDADFHAQMVETYDARIGAIRKAQRALSRTSDEGTGCVVPEATVRYIRDTLHFAMSEITEREDFRQQAQECIDELDRAIAEQGGQEGESDED